jgi:carbon-monoxide dehydrogenase small subunit
MSVRLLVNGEACEAAEEGRLVDWLRDALGLTAVKIGCEIGRCGACMVGLEGEPVNACLVPMWRLDGKSVVTPEGLDGDLLAEAVRRALAEENAFQCGYCAPGLTMSLVALLRESPDIDEAGLRAGLVGHICRCTGYHSILRGALRAGEYVRAAGGNS